MFRPNPILVIAALAIATLTVSGCSGPAPSEGGDDTASEAAKGTIVIGAPFVTTGAAGSAGLEVKEGAELAIEEINAAGGVAGGYTLELNVQDTGGDAGQAVQLASAMIRDERTVALLGPLLTPEVAALYGTAESEGTVMMTPTSVGAIPGVEPGQFNDYTFRVNQPAATVAGPLIDEAITRTKAKTVTVLSVSDNPTTADMGALFEEAATDAGAEVEHVAFPQSTTDYSSIVTSIDPDVDLIAFAALPAHNVGATAAIRAAGIDAQFVGDTSMLAKEVYDNSNGASIGAWAFSPFLTDASDASTAFTSAFEAKYSKSPTVFHALAYDSVKMLAAALDAQGESSREAVQKGLSTLMHFPGATGTLSYKGSGDVIRSDIPFVEVVEDGAVEKIATIATDQPE